MAPLPKIETVREMAAALLARAQAGDAEALELVPEPDDEFANYHAHLAIARENGFDSWLAFAMAIEAERPPLSDGRLDLVDWAIRCRGKGFLLEQPLAAGRDLSGGDPWKSCVFGDTAAVAAELERNSDFPHQRAADQMTPLAAAARSQAVHHVEDRMLATARVLLNAGADPNATWRDPESPDTPLSILYAACCVARHPGMTRLLLDSGADPNDGESLYHATEGHSLDCARLLLAAGARVEGSNALKRALDFDSLPMLELLLGYSDAREAGLLRHALDRGRSTAHLRRLMASGADPTLEDDGLTPACRAQEIGREDALALFAEVGSLPRPGGDPEAFVAACARGDEAAARKIAGRVPRIVDALSPHQLRLLPELAGLGAHDGVRTMIALGWPIETSTPDWGATALNLAVFKGDAAMTALLLDAGADWRAQHGFGDNVLGTLSFASRAERIADPAPGDWLACALTLYSHGVPRSEFKARHFGFSAGLIVGIKPLRFLRPPPDPG